MTQEALPLYLQIANELRRNISDAIYQLGDQLPTEAELSARFGVNRHTLRRAIEILRHEGLVRIDRGRGTFVASAPITYPIGKRVRYNEALKAQGLKVSRKLLHLAEIPADPSLAKRLELPVGSSLILLELLSFADDRPISVGTSYFPAARFPHFADQWGQYQSISRLLQQEYGCDHIRRSTRISARMVQPNDAKLLELPLNAPILLTESINVDQQEQVIEYGVTRFRGDRMELVFENEII
ncbi:phosphonate metabolism transcriptional regulator PhnF [Oscillatoria sp. FACHB-1407]|uniref:phosphonate metabolism transcriptional regulator PhnF n=1 Tax=Oscillatoria sp. FACHB-1407 TaxID=2692847 RepID=UPI0016898FA2|nr:phosphonate metabolism transcriptional regulator PhnF [Oscillatoria sp. FACHB-1407]MBD2464156.1 phosphonate metabolism transcriptional regulator PhnF [Oscillatoria sp. FACHB-1407]